MKILNLYGGIGGNRKLWGDNHDVTAVEINPEIAKVYQDFFPNDKVVVGDAHQYLLENYNENWDFIWTSPPCPSHSRIRNVAGVGSGHIKPIYPEMGLYEEVIFLQQIFHSSGCNFNGKYCVENVIPYYEPLIKAQTIQRHLFWSNFYIVDFKTSNDNVVTNFSIENHQKKFGFNLDNYEFSKNYPKEKVLRNCVSPELGKHILDCALGKIKQQTLL